MWTQIPEPPKDGRIPAWIEWADAVKSVLLEIYPYSGNGVNVVDIPSGGKRYDFSGSSAGSSASGVAFLPFAVRIYSDTEVEISRSTGNGDYPEGFSEDDPSVIREAGSGVHFFWIRAEYDGDSDTYSFSLGVGAEVPEDNNPAENPTRYFVMGSWDRAVDGESVSWTLHNDSYGPLEVVACPNEFVNPPTYNLVRTV